MPSTARCPRCGTSLADGEGSCPDHGSVAPWWSPQTVDYDSLVEHLARCALPSLVPWPLPEGWFLSGFGSVGEAEAARAASMLAVSGYNDLDGVLDMTVVLEEPGVGLGAHIAGWARSDPGAEIAGVSAHAKVRVAGRPVPLWAVEGDLHSDQYDRSVFAGEAQGRWLWLVLRPTSAALLLNREWAFTDASDLGPALVEVRCAGEPPLW